MYKVELSREAQRFYERADKSVAKKLARCFQSLETDPRAGNNVKALKGPLAGAFRYRVGDLRVVCHRENSKETRDAENSKGPGVFESPVRRRPRAELRYA